MDCRYGVRFLQQSLHFSPGHAGMLFSDAGGVLVNGIVLSQNCLKPTPACVTRLTSSGA